MKGSLLEKLTSLRETSSQHVTSSAEERARDCQSLAILCSSSIHYLRWRYGLCERVDSFRECLSRGSGPSYSRPSRGDTHRLSSDAQCLVGLSLYPW